MITADQLVAHAVGDYLLQSDWMARRKTGTHLPAALHALAYTAAFLPLTRSPARLAAIAGAHFLMDRYRLARYVCWAKNGPWHPLTATGYPAATPDWLAVWLLIICDNILHITINATVLRWL